MNEILGTTKKKSSKPRSKKDHYCEQETTGK